MTNTSEEGISCTLTVTQTFTKNRIADLLTSALEGGSNYWYCIDKEQSVEPPEIDPVLMPGESTFFHLHWPLSDGGSVCFFDRETDEDEREHWYLDLAAIARGLQVMADEHPGHLADFANENDDAETGDVFLQCCLFGELVFG